MAALDACRIERSLFAYQRQRAADLVEYGMLIALVAVVVLLGVGAFGNAMVGWFSLLAGHITTTGT